MANRRQRYVPRGAPRSQRRWPARAAEQHELAVRTSSDEPGKLKSRRMRCLGAHGGGEHAIARRVEGRPAWRRGEAGTRCVGATAMLNLNTVRRRPDLADDKVPEHRHPQTRQGIKSFASNHGSVSATTGSAAEAPEDASDVARGRSRRHDRPCWTERDVGRRRGVGCGAAPEVPPTTGGISCRARGRERGRGLRGRRRSNQVTSRRGAEARRRKR